VYRLDPQKKADPQRRWNLPDRIFFGHGACHILAGVYLCEFPNSPLRPLWLRPLQDLPGNHVLLSDGVVAYDYHGYSVLSRLLQHQEKVWRAQHAQWQYRLEPVTFDLLDTAELNARNMRGPDQYLGDAVGRALRYLDRIGHELALAKAQSLVVPPGQI